MKRVYSADVMTPSLSVSISLKRKRASYLVVGGSLLAAVSSSITSGCYSFYEIGKIGLNTSISYFCAGTISITTGIFSSEAASF
jgi:hypothetical protein